MGGGKGIHAAGSLMSTGIVLGHPTTPYFLVLLLLLLLMMLVLLLLVWFGLVF